MYVLASENELRHYSENELCHYVQKMTSMNSISSLSFLALKQYTQSHLFVSKSGLPCVLVDQGLQQYGFDKFHQMCEAPKHQYMADTDLRQVLLDGSDSTQLSPTYRNAVLNYKTCTHFKSNGGQYWLIGSFLIK